MFALYAPGAVCISNIIVRELINLECSSRLLMVREHMVLEHMVQDNKPRPRSPKSAQNAWHRMLLSTPDSTECMA